MQFYYQAIERGGAAAQGQIEAATLVEARTQLRGRGLFVTSINELADQTPIKTRTRRTKKADVVMLFSQLTIMTHSGVPLTEALESCAEQCPKPAFRQIIQALHDEVSSGSTFANALTRHPGAFDEALIAAVAAGEQSSAITEVLDRLTYLMRADMRLRNAVLSMLSYPLVLCAMTFLVFNALIFFVLPQFSQVFLELGQPAPPLTQFLLDLGETVRGNLLTIVVVGGGLLALAYSARNAEAARRLWDHLTLNLMVVGGATSAICTGRTFRLMGVMLMSGVPLVDAIRLCRLASRNRLFRELFDDVESDVLHGEGLGRRLLASPILPAGAAQMVATAERSGKLGEVLKMVGEYFEDEGERRLREVVKIIEPAVIVLLGVVVAAVALSVVLPLLDVSTVTQ
jgi:type II secretory pathway component PulF